eukprot:gene721-1099_t
MSISSDENDTLVQFQTANGDHVRFSALPTGGLREQVFRDDAWVDSGVALELNYNPGTGSLTDQNGLGGVLPADSRQRLLRKLASIAQLANVEHNLDGLAEGSHRAASLDDMPSSGFSFKTPAGDIVRFTPTGDGVLEELQLGADRWVTVGTATELYFDPDSRSLLDQDGAGGVLPVEEIAEVLRGVKAVADTAGIGHDLFVPSPDQVAAMALHAQEQRRQSLHAASHLSVPNAGRGGPGTYGGIPRTRRRVSKSQDTPAARAPLHGGSYSRIDVDNISLASPASGSLDSSQASLPHLSLHDGRRPTKALLIGTAGPTRTEAAKQGVLAALRCMHGFLRYVMPSMHIQTLEDSKTAGLLARDELVRGLEWLVDGAAAGDAVFVGLVGVSEEGRSRTVTLAGGDFTTQDWQGFFLALPPGLRATVVCDYSPATDLIELPYRAVPTKDGTGHLLTHNHGCYPPNRTIAAPPDVVVVSATSFDALLEDTPMGALAAAVGVSAQHKGKLTFSQLLANTTAALARSPGAASLVPVVSSYRAFDADRSLFSVLGCQIATAVSRAPSSNASSSNDEHAKHSYYYPRPPKEPSLDTDSAVREALLAVYQKHNPAKIELVDRFVADYK